MTHKIRKVFLGSSLSHLKLLTIMIFFSLLLKIVQLVCYISNKKLLSLNKNVCFLAFSNMYSRIFFNLIATHLKFSAKGFFRTLLGFFDSFDMLGAKVFLQTRF